MAPGHRLWPWLGKTVLGSGAEMAPLAPMLGATVPRWLWPWGWSGARGAAASWQGTREPQAALIYTLGWDWAGTGGKVATSQAASFSSPAAQ